MNITEGTESLGGFSQFVPFVRVVICWNSNFKRSVDWIFEAKRQSAPAPSRLRAVAQGRTMRHHRAHVCILIGIAAWGIGVGGCSTSVESDVTEALRQSAEAVRISEQKVRPPEVMIHD